MSASPDAAARTTDVAPYDALLICSYGGPNTADDVVPFLRSVVKGRGIPDERLAEVGEHYYGFGGKSPINEQNLALRAAIERELRSRGIALPVLWGNRHWHPYTVDVLRDAVAFGAKRILVLITAAYASYSGSRQYREHLAEAVAALDEPGLEVDILRPFFNDPGFVEANAERIRQALGELDGDEGAHIAFVTHSIPETMQLASTRTGPGYLQQHEDVIASITASLAESGHAPVGTSLSFCSRSGDPRTPWLEPDINDRLEALAAEGTNRVVIAPIGFISDHMEVAFDLDVEAMATANDQGLDARRAGTVGVHDTFVAGIVDLVLERAARERGASPEVTVLGAYDAFPDVAPPGSCRARDGVVTGLPVIAGTED